MYNNCEKSYILLDALTRLDYKHKRAIIKLYSNCENLFENHLPAVEYLKGVGLESIATTLSSAIKSNYINDLIKKYNEKEITVICLENSAYSNLLLQTPIPPFCLYAKGNIELLNRERCLSVVGSRKTLPLYLKLTEQICSELSNAGVVIVTGVALGGDTSAIKGALDSGNLICVLAGGHDFIKSEMNRDLIEKATKKGLVISEYPPEVAPVGYHYPIRNRIIAGISEGCLIVSGEMNSGTRHTLSFALDYGREVMAFPYTVGTFGGELCNSIIKEGATLVTCCNDVSSFMGYDSAESNAVELEGNSLIIYNSIKNGNNTIDDIVLDTNLKIYEVMPEISLLEIYGIIVKSASGEYQVLK